MELIKFLKDNKGLFSLSGIESKLKMPKDSLRNAINNKCILSSEDGVRVIELLGSFKGLSYMQRKKRSIKKVIVFDKNVALDMSEFEFVSLSVVRHKSGVAIRVIRRGGEYYPR